MSIADKLTLIAENQQKVYEAGQAAGGYSDGYEAGRYDEWDLFWETYQQGGARTGYADDYGYGKWTDDTFKPKYILWASANGAQFREATITNYEALKMVDFSKVQQWANYFRSSKIPHLGVIDTRGTYNPASLDHTFYLAQIEVIDKIIIRNDGKTTFTNIFHQAPNLTSVTFEGVIGNYITFGSCPNLTRESILNIIEHLQDFSGTTTTKTIVFNATAKARLTEEDIAIATQKGWTVA